jgi:hypothetical protein
MSEPVGNSPRAPGDIPGNARKDREARQEKEVEPREPVQKIIEGKVVTRRPPWYKRFGRSLIADDAQSMGDWIMVEIILPAVRNLISDTVKGSTDRILYGTSRARRSGLVGDRPGLRTRYDRISSDPGEPRRMLSRESRARHDFDDVVLSTHAEAVDVVEALIARVERYGAASVSDLYELVGVTGSFADQRWGWTDLRDADVRQVRGGFLLDLPRPEPIR